MVEDRKYAFVLERLNEYAKQWELREFSAKKVDLLFQRVDRRLQEIKIGAPVYEMQRVPNHPTTAVSRSYGPLNKWTVVGIDYESGMIDVTNEKGNVLEKKSILILEPFEDGFELYRQIVEWDFRDKENGCEDFFNCCPEYWSTNNTPISFYASDVLSEDYLIEHNLPNFIVNIVIDPKKREVNVITDAPKKYEKEVLQIIDSPQYTDEVCKNIPECYPDTYRVRRASKYADFDSRIMTAYNLRCQSIGDIVSYSIINAESVNQYIFKRKYVFDDVYVIKPPKKSYFMSNPLLYLIRKTNWDNLCQFDENEDRFTGEYLITHKVMGAMLLGYTFFHWLDRPCDGVVSYSKKTFWKVFLKIVDLLIESFEKRNATNFWIYKDAIKIKEKFGKKS